MELIGRSVFNVVTGYLSFGLALYAVGAFVALLRLRRAKGLLCELVLSDFNWVYICILLVVLGAIRQIWDAFHIQHFPIEITRAIVPYANLCLGNSIFRIAKRNSGVAGPNGGAPAAKTAS